MFLEVANEDILYTAQ